MPNAGTRFLLFVSSYFPMAFMFFWVLVFKHRWAAIIILSFAVFGLIVLKVWLKIANELAPTSVEVTQIQRKDADTVSYIATYVLPFLTIPFSDLQQTLILTTFFFMVGILYMNSNMIHINPMLNLTGYHIYEMILSDGRTCSIISKNTVKRGAELSVIAVGDDLYLEKEVARDRRPKRSRAA